MALLQCISTGCVDFWRRCWIRDVEEQEGSWRNKLQSILGLFLYPTFCAGACWLHQNRSGDAPPLKNGPTWKCETSQTTEGYFLHWDGEIRRYLLCGIISWSGGEWTDRLGFTNNASSGLLMTVCDASQWPCRLSASVCQSSGITSSAGWLFHVFICFPINTYQKISSQLKPQARLQQQ